MLYEVYSFYQGCLSLSLVPFKDILKEQYHDRTIFLKFWTTLCVCDRIVCRCSIGRGVYFSNAYAQNCVSKQKIGSVDLAMSMNSWIQRPNLRPCNHTIEYPSIYFFTSCVEPKLTKKYLLLIIAHTLKKGKKAAHPRAVLIF